MEFESIRLYLQPRSNAQETILLLGVRWEEETGSSHSCRTAVDVAGLRAGRVAKSGGERTAITS